MAAPLARSARNLSSALRCFSPEPIFAAVAPHTSSDWQGNRAKQEQSRRQRAPEPGPACSPFQVADRVAMPASLGLPARPLHLTPYPHAAAAPLSWCPPSRGPALPAVPCSRSLHSSHVAHSAAEGSTQEPEVEPRAAEDEAAESKEEEDDDDIAEAVRGLSVQDIVGRIKGLEASVDKVVAAVPDARALLRDTRRGQLKKIGLPCQQRKQLLRALEQLRQGTWDPSKGALA